MRNDEAEVIARAAPRLRRPLSSVSAPPPVREPQAPAPAQEPSQAPPTQEAATPTPEPPKEAILLPAVVPAPPASQVSLPKTEIVLQAATDSLFFCQHYFPKTFRQGFATFHSDMWTRLDDPAKRYVNMQVMRDGAKTTILRAYAAKRIGYGLSRTILYIAASEGKARNSLQWIKRQIEFNKTYTTDFGLAPVKRNWSTDRIEIRQTVPGQEPHSIWVLGLGILGSTRGINID